MIVLRDYQQEMLDRLQRAWRRHRSVMVQMPTGTGKTVLMAEIVRGCLAEGVLIVAHRRELIAQIKQTLAAFGIETDTENDRVVVESIQKLSRSEHESPRIGRGFVPKLVIVDEAHHALAATYRMLWERWPKAKFLGLTATPCRLNDAPFTDLFDTLLQSWTIQAFIDKGWLTDFEYVSASPDSAAMRRIRNLKKRGADGDYQMKELTTVMDVPASIEHLYKTYQKFAGGNKGIVYAIDRAHAAHIAAYYAEHGVRCAVIDSKTPTGERQRLIEDYKKKNDVLINVDIFSEGFDCPEVEFIQLARPTLSLSKYLQQVGRGMRVSKGKPHVLILDNVGLYQTFGLPTEERDWRQTFYGLASGRGEAGAGRYVVVEDPVMTETFGRSVGTANPRQRELVNLEMVRIKKAGKRHAGLEIILKGGLYGVMNSGKVTCQPRFKKIVRLRDASGYFAAGVYGGLYDGHRVEYSSLIDRKGIDLRLKLFRDVEWHNGYFSGSYAVGDGDQCRHYYNYWDPKGQCYYNQDPEFRVLAGVEVAYAQEHFNNDALCLKLRYTTGLVSPRFHFDQLYYNRHIIVARDYLVVKNDRNHAYRICGFLPGSVLVQSEGTSGYQQIYTDGRKGHLFNSLPPEAKRSILQVQQLGLRRL